uniref:FAD:protein FMN transferase n=1 Tax=Sinorhizobium chiapasense TaxID=501572 RepID=UPI002FE344A3
MDKPVDRRRFITIMAAFAGLPLLRGKGWAALPAEPVVWHGQAMGAPATLVLNHQDRAQAQALITRVVAEVRRLEDIFSLYRDDSALSQLNRLGALAAPPTELVELLEISGRFHDLTAGRFEPAIQPLWALYARHFAKPDADPAGPSYGEVREALALADFAQVRIDRNRIAFSRRGMALTLNGIAQGYVTDRVVGLLREAGVTSSLVDMGENRAIGSRADGQPWRIGLAEFGDANDVDATLDITDRAVATSSGRGFQFDAEGRFSHILDPRSGATAKRYARVSVVAPEASTADALSTAFSLMAPDEIDPLLKQQTSVDIHLRSR